jgi:hypothetical protein
MNFRVYRTGSNLFPLMLASHNLFGTRVTVWAMWCSGKPTAACLQPLPLHLENSPYMLGFCGYTPPRLGHG